MQVLYCLVSDHSQLASVTLQPLFYECLTRPNIDHSGMNSIQNVFRWLGPPNHFFSLNLSLVTSSPQSVHQTLACDHSVANAKTKHVLVRLGQQRRVVVGGGVAVEDHLQQVRREPRRARLVLQRAPRRQLLTPQAGRRRQRCTDRITYIFI